MASRGSRGLGMSKADLEASRLVFVYLAQSKPKRKVAIPVPDSYTWEQFLDQVKSRLRLTGIRDIYLASTGTKVRSVGELQDIDELCVVEGPTDEIYGNASISIADAEKGGAEIEPQGSHGASLRQQGRQPSLPLERHRSGAPNGSGYGGGGAHSGMDQEDDKYARRAHPLKRTLQRVLPGLFPAASLPVTLNDASMDGGGGGGKSTKRRRSRRSRLTAQNVLAVMAILSCFGTMVFFFARVNRGGPGSLMPAAAGPGGVGGGGGGPQAAAEVPNVAAVPGAPGAGAAGGGGGGVIPGGGGVPAEALGVAPLSAGGGAGGAPTPIPVR